MSRFFSVVTVLISLIVFGSVGYIVVEDWPLSDSFFMTVITFSTVGYGETHGLSPAGRTFTSLLIFLSLVAMTYSTACLTSFIVENDLHGNFTRRRVLKMISHLKDHVIVCGSGCMAVAVLERLSRMRVPVVVLDHDSDALENLKKRFRKIHTVTGSPTNELALAEANILNARAVVATLDSEIDNLLIGITCKDLGHDVEVVANSSDPILGNRMRKAGIDQVVSASQLWGDHVASLLHA